jgi:hypothetical protein
MTFSSWVYRSTAEFPVKTGSIKLALHTCSFISSLDNELQKLKWGEVQDDSHLFVFTPCIRVSPIYITKWGRTKNIKIISTLIEPGSGKSIKFWVCSVLTMLSGGVNLSLLLFSRCVIEHYGFMN